MRQLHARYVCKCARIRLTFSMAKLPGQIFAVDKVVQQSFRKPTCACNVKIFVVK